MLGDALWFIAGLVGGALITELVGWLKSSRDRRYAAFRTAWDDPRRFEIAISMLKQLYGSKHELLCPGQRVYPCIAWAALGEDVETVLRSPLLEPETDAVLVGSSEYRLMVNRRMKDATGRGLYNGDIYRMLNVVTDPSAQLVCSPGFGAYFDMLDSCEALEYELMSAVPSVFPRRAWTRKLVLATVSRRLKLRRNVHALVGDPVKDGAGRIAGVGGSTVTIYKEDGCYRVLVPKRSDDAVAGQKGLYAVVPTFIMEAARGAVEEEYSVARNVGREYAEEILGHSRINKVSASGDRNDALQDLLNAGTARLRPLGITMNLLNLRPDVCSLLVIDDESWAADSIALSWEFSEEGQRLNNRSVGDHLAALNAGRLLFEPHEIAPSCAGALWLALNHPEVQALA